MTENDSTRRYNKNRGRPPITSIRVAREETVTMTDQELDNAVEALAVLVTRHWDYLRRLHQSDVTLAA